MEIINSVIEAVGRTKLLRLNKVCKGYEILAKMEYLNPSGSMKDRVAEYIIEKLEAEKLINKRTALVEATTGSTGIAFSMVCAVKGYKMKVVMPNQVSNERKKIIRAFGGKLVYVPGFSTDISNALEKVKELKEKHGENLYPINQFSSQLNSEAHEKTTAKEIIEQTEGKIGAFVASVGTGGALMGVARAFKKAEIKAKIVAVEPEECALLSGKKKGRHKIEGIADGIVPDLIDMELIDWVEMIPQNEAIAMAKRLIKEEGVLCGLSSGINVSAALNVAKKLGKNKRVVTILPDSATRYFSTDLFKSF